MAHASAPTLPAPETPLEIIAGGTRIGSHVVAVDRNTILVARPAEPLPSRVVVRWVDRKSKRQLSVEALAATLPKTAMIALAPVESVGAERRSRPRHAVRFSCRVDGTAILADGSRGRPFTGHLVDVSSAGLAVATSTEIAAGTRIEITVKRSTSGAYLRGRRARVAYCRPHEKRGFLLGCDLSADMPEESGLAALVEDAIAGKPF